MKFKMTKEHIDTINELLKTHGDTLTVFYDEGVISGAMGATIAVNSIWIILSIIKNHKEKKRLSPNKGSFFFA